MKPIFVDPFAGKCIHGVPGARFEGGIKVNPDCAVCQHEAIAVGPGSSWKPWKKEAK